jgi:CheY-like chemotaxis protein
MTARVLIVEDDRDIREAMAEGLEDAGYSVLTAENGADALARLRQAAAARPAIILLDLMMPVMDGFQFRAEQQRDPLLAGIPVIVISAGVRADPNKIEADAVLQKPVDILTVVRTIERVTMQHHS